MKIIPALALITTLIMASCSSSDKKDDSKKDAYEQTKEKLADAEKKTPADFLSVSGHDKRNLFGQTVVKGMLTNKAKVVSYKDVEVKLYFYSKTGALLEEDVETVFEIIGPGKSTDFKTRYLAPKGTDSVALKVMGAKVE